MITVYNTMSRKKEEFKPIRNGEVSIYCCGVTPYNDPHIGNARPFVTWDVIRRYFEYQGYKVKYIQNFTDVDDKIITVANKENVEWHVIADRYIKSYFESMEALNVRKANFFPRVSESMDDIITLIEKLIERGYAYKAKNGDVYYSVEKFADYGRLSGRSLEDMRAGARVDVNDKKYNPMDFALWKAAKANEPSWKSPWGKGRPGWHIECSAMSLKYLGETFDFHGGGSDLIFPHHENEIAQSEPCIDSDNKFARYWVHNGFITINNEKMSKSQNNFFTIKEILREFSGEVIRFFMLQTHYRSPLDFSYDSLIEARTALTRLATSKRLIDEINENFNDNVDDNTALELRNMSESSMVAFNLAMKDDFNTALAISHLFTLSRGINRYYQEIENSKSADKKNFAIVAEIFAIMTHIIGIFEQEDMQVNDNLNDKLMKIIINIRQEMRVLKNWELSDKIRDDLKDIGIALEDTPNGVRYKKL